MKVDKYFSFKLMITTIDNQLINDFLSSNNEFKRSLLDLELWDKMNKTNDIIIIQHTFAYMTTLWFWIEYNPEADSLRNAWSFALTLNYKAITDMQSIAGVTLGGELNFPKENGDYKLLRPLMQVILFRLRLLFSKVELKRMTIIERDSTPLDPNWRYCLSLAEDDSHLCYKFTYAFHWWIIHDPFITSLCSFTSYLKEHPNDTIEARLTLDKVNVTLDYLHQLIDNYNINFYEEYDEHKR